MTTRDKPLRDALVLNGKTYKVIRKAFNPVTGGPDVCKSCDLRKKCDGNNLCRPFWKKGTLPHFRLV